MAEPGAHRCGWRCYHPRYHADSDRDVIMGRNLPPNEQTPLHLHPVTFEAHSAVATRATREDGQDFWTIAARLDTTIIASCAECENWHPEVGKHTAPDLLRFTMEHSGLNAHSTGQEVLALLEHLANTGRW